jgi:hypothetical protein
MKSNFGHVQVNIDPQDLNFYRDLFAFLDWSVLYEDENMLGVGDEKGASVWFTAPIKPQEKNDYDGLGMNHLRSRWKNRAMWMTFISFSRNMPSRRCSELLPPP